MTREEDRAPLSTEISSSETEVDPQAPRRSDNGSRDPDPSKADAAPDDRLGIGERLSGRYRIERELGEGGMGVVYLARDEQIAGETFAIKVLKEGLRPEALAQLREEVRKTRKLSHPNIVDVHSVNVDGKRLYVLMEYLEGNSLDRLLDEEFARGIPFSHAWPIIEDVGAALGNAHDHNVIHSDLKPANVFVTNSGRTKLLDFGIAQVSRGPLLQKWSGTRALTPAYASCEMLEGEEADRRDDIYSFACVIYQMLSGDRPFGELNALEARDVGTRVPPLAVLSQAQNEALAQALAFDRAARTPSVEQLLAGLGADKAPSRSRNAVLVSALVATLAVLGFAYLALDKLWISRRSVVVQPVASETQPANPRAAATPVAFNPPPHSIAVLPFVNISGDKEQEYFSEGLTEELLNSLSRINELQVAARTSSFYFKGEHADLSTIARKLNVASILEGSVRRSGQTVRVTAQLNNAVTGYHLWSQAYDRDLGDVLQLQAEIATAVAGALKVTLLGDEAARIELGGTRNPAAFDAYLRASRAYISRRDFRGIPGAIAAYTEAIRLDPNFALAYAGRAEALSQYMQELTTGAAAREGLARAKTDASHAIALAPELAQAHLALGYVFEGSLDFERASQEYERARALAPGTAKVLAWSGHFAAEMGKTTEALTTLRYAAMLDPLARESHARLASALYLTRRYKESVAAFTETIRLAPDYTYAYAGRGLALYALGDLQSARASCEVYPDIWASQKCLPIVYDKLGRHSDAQAALAKFKSARGEDYAYEYATIYAQWGDRTKALELLERAVRVRDAGLGFLKTDPLLDALRSEPRFQAIERELKFPE